MQVAGASFCFYSTREDTTHRNRMIVQHGTADGSMLGALSYIGVERLRSSLVGYLSDSVRSFIKTRMAMLPWVIDAASLKRIANLETEEERVLSYSKLVTSRL